MKSLRCFHRNLPRPCLSSRHGRGALRPSDSPLAGWGGRRAAGARGASCREGAACSRRAGVPCLQHSPAPCTPVRPRGPGPNLPLSRRCGRAPPASLKAATPTTRPQGQAGQEAVSRGEETQPLRRGASCFVGRAVPAGGELQRQDCRTKRVRGSLWSFPALLSWLRWMSDAHDEIGKTGGMRPWYQSSLGCVPEGVSGSWSLSAAATSTAPTSTASISHPSSAISPLPAPPAGPSAGPG